MDSQILIEKIGNKEFEEVFSDLEREKTREVVKENIFDIILSCCAPLGEKDLDPQSRQQYEALLAKVISFANPKEVLMAMVEELNCFKENSFFYSILEPIKMALLKITSKKDKYYDWILNLLYPYVLASPKESVDPLLEITNSFVDFLATLVESHLKAREVQLVQTNIGLNREKQVLIKFLINVLHYPLIHFSFDSKDVSDPLNQCAGKIINLLTQLEPNMGNIICNPNIEREEESSDGDNEKTVPTEVYLGLGNLSYLIFCKNMFSFPAIFSHQYLLETCFSYMIALISQTASVLLHKGLQLSSYLLKHFAPKSITKESLDEINYNVFPKHLFKILTYCSDDKMRSEARSLIFSYFLLFDSPSRYELLVSLWHCEEHPGIKGFLLVIFKHNYSLYVKQQSDSIFGDKLEKFLALVVKLPTEDELNILEQNECILETLNFLILLFLLPNSPLKQVNSSLVVQINSYISTLKNKVSFDKALNKKYIEEEAEKKNPNKEMLNNLRIYYNHFDIIESVLARATEVCFF